MEYGRFVIRARVVPEVELRNCHLCFAQSVALVSTLFLLVLKDTALHHSFYRHCSVRVTTLSLTVGSKSVCVLYV